MARRHHHLILSNQPLLTHSLPSSSSSPSFINSTRTIHVAVHPSNFHHPDSPPSHHGLTGSQFRDRAGYSAFELVYGCDCLLALDFALSWGVVDRSEETAGRADRTTDIPKPSEFRMRMVTTATGFAQHLSNSRLAAWVSFITSKCPIQDHRAISWMTDGSNLTDSDKSRMILPFAGWKSLMVHRWPPVCPKRFFLVQNLTTVAPKYTKR